MSDIITSFALLTANNYTEWYESIKRRAHTLNIWEYVDPETDLAAPPITAPPAASEVLVGANSATDLDDEQLKKFTNLRTLWRQESAYAQDAARGI